MSARRVLIIGSNGLLGQKMVDLFVRGSAFEVTQASVEPEPIRNHATSHYVQMDLRVKKEVKDVAASCEPEVIINCAAMTNVDACETERETAWKINVGGVENIIEAARRNNARIVHVSSDYIFDGKSGPYAEDDRPNPLSYYGKTKLAGENALRVSGLEFLIARTMVLYGYAPGTKKNFAIWLIESLEKEIPVRIVNDQYGNATLADDLAYGIMRGVELGKTGIYNIAGRDIANRFDFAVRLAQVFGLNQNLIMPIKTEQLKQPAARPLRSGLITLKAETELGIKPATMEEGLIVLKSQMTQALRRLGDSAPVPGSASRRNT